MVSKIFAYACTLSESSVWHRELGAGRETRQVTLSTLTVFCAGILVGVLLSIAIVYCLYVIEVRKEKQEQK